MTFDAAAIDALDALFADFGQKATWRRSGAIVAKPLIVLNEPRRDEPLGGGYLATEPLSLEVRRSEVATPIEGDTVTLGDGRVMTVQGRPSLDRVALVWSARLSE